MTVLNTTNRSPLDCLGYASTEGHAEDTANRIRINNYANFFGYFPIIGTIVGLARMIFNAYLMTITEDESEMELYKAQIVRGAVEFISFGIIFLIPDLIVTRARTLNPKLEPNKEEENVPIS